MVTTMAVMILVMNRRHDDDHRRYDNDRQRWEYQHGQQIGLRSNVVSVKLSARAMGTKTTTAITATTL